MARARLGLAALFLYTATASSAPLSDITAISAGERFTCAIDSTGRVWCWGRNNAGQLGDGTFDESAVPVVVDDIGEPVDSISAGKEHVCAVTLSGAAACWGGNLSGQLGDGTTSNSAVPVTPAGLGSGVASITSGFDHTCATTDAGAALCWGSDAQGQLGNAGDPAATAPDAVFGLSAGVAFVRAEGQHSCAVTTGGGLKCWGYNIFGQLGLGYTTSRDAPFDVPGYASGVATVAGGDFHTCFIVDSDSSARCMGRGGEGQIGDGDFDNELSPVLVSGLGTAVVHIQGDRAHTCAIDSGGGVLCFGDNRRGQLGDGTTTASATPVAVTGLGSGFVQVALGWGHSCALDGVAGTVWCWGLDQFGQLGDGEADGDLSANPAPRAVVGPILFADGFEAGLPAR